MVNHEGGQILPRRQDVSDAPHEVSPSARSVSADVAGDVDESTRIRPADRVLRHSQRHADPSTGRRGGECAHIGSTATPRCDTSEAVKFPLALIATVTLVSADVQAEAIIVESLSTATVEGEAFDEGATADPTVFGPNQDEFAGPTTGGAFASLSGASPDGSSSIAANASDTVGFLNDDGTSLRLQRLRYHCRRPGRAE